MRCGKGFQTEFISRGLTAAAAVLMVAAHGRADGIFAVTNHNGEIVYINTNTPNPGQGRLHAPEASVQNPQIGKIDTLADQIASQHRVDPSLVHAVIQVESDYDPKAVSSKGAMGLMQLIPETAARLGVGNPFDPRQNIEGGVTYLKYLLKLFHGSVPLALAAYNAGENSVIRWGGIPPITETQDYVQKVTRLYRPNRQAGAQKATDPQVSTAPILRYVDAQGVVHFTNTE
jgi:soluble lytic murein transglycosylase-like protein